LQPSSRLSESRKGLCQCGGDDGHLVNLIGIAATGEVVDGSIQALQNGAVCGKATQTLCNLIANVAGLNFGEDKGVCVACHGGAGELQLTHGGRNGSVKLHLAVDGKIGSSSLCFIASILHLIYVVTLTRTLGGVAQEGNLRVNAKGLCGCCALQCGLDQGIRRRG